MKPEDFRIGNIAGLTDGHGELMYGHVTSIKEDCIYINTIKVDNRFIKPLPLTEEWLKSFGADTQTRVHETSNFDWLGWVGSIKVVGKPETVRVFVCMGGVCSEMGHISAVHQLQNLFYALTGHELTLNEAPNATP